ncbi:uncharacterized protein N7511_006280 [Penicillium nucicola]|uniref:uncharacterized protein n=1 Tax=Penicillium nucicola TaxID=1850975 RepID=UPI002544F2C9|nr:uncharacterized protein N7511_006280 [Penicillium nucicola]KAJ5757586.1 hypothetical protein N7511_006280 [Penicillium nucicola]
MGCDNPISESDSFAAPANTFLKEEVYRLGSSPGLRSLPPGPERDFLTLTWGPIVYRTAYAPETKRLLPIFLRSLNDSVSQSLHRTMTGSDEEIRILAQTFASKVFSARDMYADLDEEGVRDVFHEFKVSLMIPETELPSRLRVCLMIDEAVLSHLKDVLDLATLQQKDAAVGRCWVKVVEENFPDSRLDDHPNVDDVDTGGISWCMKNARGRYHGWTMVALDALIEVFDGLRELRGLVEYHREGRAYLGCGKWSA